MSKGLRNFRDYLMDRRDMKQKEADKLLSTVMSQADYILKTDGIQAAIDHYKLHLGHTPGRIGRFGL